MNKLTYVNGQVLNDGAVIDANPHVYMGFGGAFQCIAFTCAGVRYAGHLKGARITSASEVIEAAQAQDVLCMRVVTCYFDAEGYSASDSAQWSKVCELFGVDLADGQNRGEGAWVNVYVECANAERARLIAQDAASALGKVIEISGGDPSDE